MIQLNKKCYNNDTFESYYRINTFYLLDTIVYLRLLLHSIKSSIDSIT